MNTLWAKLAVLIAVVIISVVGILTALLFYMLDPPDEQQGIRPMADQVQLLERIARAAPDLVSIQQKPAEGKVMVETTTWLRDMLEAQGEPRDVLVTRVNSSDPVALSIPVGNGWLITQLTDLPPEGGIFNLLLKWLAFIAFGAMVVALFFCEPDDQASRPP